MIMKKYLLLSLLCFVTVANMHGEGVVGEIGEVGETGMTGHSGHYELFCAIWSNNVSEVKRLIASGADVNEKGDTGCTLLYFAAQANFLNIAQVLIDAGADVNAQNNWGATSLHIAAAFGADRVLELLLRAGADVTLKDKAGYTALDGAEMFARRNEKVIALLKDVEAANASYLSIIKAGGLPGNDVYWNAIRAHLFDAARVTSVVIPPVMVALQFLVGHWIYNHINTMNSDARIRHVLAIRLLRGKTFGSVTSNVPQLGDLVLDYVGKNID
jgi:hypothetical protein